MRENGVHAPLLNTAAVCTRTALAAPVAYASTVRGTLFGATAVCTTPTLLSLGPQTSPPKVWIMKRPSVQAGPPSWCTEVQAGPQRKHAVVAVWLPDGTRPPDVRKWAPQVRPAKGTSERNEYLSLPMHGETVGGHAIKHSINLTFTSTSFEQPTCPACSGGPHQTATVFIRADRVKPRNIHNIWR
jgi:hypothetical protein